MGVAQEGMEVQEETVVMGWDECLMCMKRGLPRQAHLQE